MSTNKILELNEIFKLCRLHGVTKLVQGNLTIEFGADPNAPIIMPVSDTMKETIGGDLKPTHDELLMWSAGGEDIRAALPDNN